jgi:high-affinity Fe2+/Pb2+ permease
MKIKWDLMNLSMIFYTTFTLLFVISILLFVIWWLFVTAKLMNTKNEILKQEVLILAAISNIIHSYSKKIDIESMIRLEKQKNSKVISK